MYNLLPFLRLRSHFLSTSPPISPPPPFFSSSHQPQRPARIIAGRRLARCAFTPVRSVSFQTAVCAPSALQVRFGAIIPFSQTPLSLVVLHFPYLIILYFDVVPF